MAKKPTTINAAGQKTLFPGRGILAAKTIEQVHADISALTGTLSFVLESKRGLTKANILCWKQVCHENAERLQMLLDRLS